MDAATAMSSVWTMQSIFLGLSTLNLTGYMFPETSIVSDDTTFDFIIVGGGSTGCVMARRLTEVRDFNVLVIEAGGDPPIESMYASLFPYLPNSTYDWNLFTENDNYSLQYHKGEVTAATQGKMLGGSSSLGHLINVRGNPHDYEAWEKAANDPAWGWDGLYPYFRKPQKLVDRDLLNSDYAQYYGTDGYLGLTRDPHDELNPLLAAAKEMGNDVVLDTNGNYTLGYANLVYHIDGQRQTLALALGEIKYRSNLHVLKNTLVTKILFNGNTAYGVQTQSEDGETKTFKASKEVIVAAGTINTPKLLMLSGVGPSDHLSSFGIEVISDIPVGQNYHDHVSIPIIHTLEPSDAPAVSVNPNLFPVPAMTGFKAMNPEQTYPDYQAIPFFFPHDSVSILAFCSSVFTYKDEVCDAIYNASIGRNILWTVHNIMHPESRGQILLKSTDPKDPPLIYPGVLSNENDLNNLATYVADFAKIVNTTYFKSINSEFLTMTDVVSECADLELYSTEYWRCYTLKLSATLFHYGGTCSLGSVVDSRLRVIGTSNLRVVDASVMPSTTSGNILAPVITIAEKGADLIKEDFNISIASLEVSNMSDSEQTDTSTSQEHSSLTGKILEPIITAADKGADLIKGTLSIFKG